MNSQKFLVGGIVGGIVFFLLGYVFYGLLLKDFFATNGMAANMDTMIWWAMIVGNLVSGFLIAYILGKANVSSPLAGAGVGFVVGLLMSASFDLINYGIGHGMTLKGVFADIFVGAVIAAITGAVIGSLMRSKKAIATA
jgi:hypothetical protein